MATLSEFPDRYEPLEQLGKGGGGEVWAARDRVTGQVAALKLLREDADEPEMLALVREATMLSGVEGLGVPRVLHFGRLARSGRAFMVRELAEGRSLADLLAEPAEPAEAARQYLSNVVRAAQLVTRLHRALLLHGDIKPANIIVDDDRVTLVDLGLAAHWQEGGARPRGLTPRYAAPELFRGEPLTPRAEVFALGATAAEVLGHAGQGLPKRTRRAVEKVVARATAEQATERHPSADEFAEALRRAAELEAGPALPPARAWSMGGVDELCAELLATIRARPSGGGLVVIGPRGSGRTTLLRRACWSLGVLGAAVTFVEAEQALPTAGRAGEAADGPLGGAPDPTGAEPSSLLERALGYALSAHNPAELTVVVDDAEKLSAADLERLSELREQGGTLVVAASSERGPVDLPGPTFELFEVRPLDEPTAARLVRRMIPSLSDKLVAHIVARAGGLPGLLREVVGRLEGAPVVSVEDVDSRLDGLPLPPAAAASPREIHRLLDRGRFDEAAELLETAPNDGSLAMAVARAKLAIARDQPQQATRLLEQAEPTLEAEQDNELAAAWHLQMARAELRRGDYPATEQQANLALTRLGASILDEMTAAEDAPEAQSAQAPAVGEVVPLASEALAMCGLAQSFASRHAEAIETLRRSVAVARASDQPRPPAVALASLALALQRCDRLDEAQAAHRESLGLAEKAGDAGSVAATRLNLAGIAKTKGDVAGALAHLEAAVDMGRRAGRKSTLRQALLNLANLDLHLGRLAKAQASIDALAAERSELGQGHQAQLLALEAESAALSGDIDTAEERCRRCAEAYEALGRNIDAAEARLERVRFLAEAAHSAPAELVEEIERARAELGDSGAHRGRLAIARGLVAKLAGRSGEARAALDEAIAEGERSGQSEWVWRSLQARAEICSLQGDEQTARTDRRAAERILDTEASALPPDLREVYWNDPRRRALRAAPAAPALPMGIDMVSEPTELASGGAREDRLARVLEINRQIAGEHDLDRLLDLVTDHAIVLLRAERGFVLMRSRSGEDRLSVHAARDRAGDDPHARFSRSVAERVVRSGEPFVAVDAGRDDRVSDFVSVHQLMLKSVASVPIRARNGRVIGALYLETRLRPGALFGDELPTLVALADQVAIAIETARLVSENQERARELEKANAELEAARARLEQLLGRRTEQLALSRRDLRSARQVLRGHFGYRGLVGSSAAMRRVYAIIERVKDADVPVLITGESGTGKEVIARAVHGAGSRRKHRFVGVNCGAIPEHLLESELFGHVRGAFTGAERNKNGLFREVGQGTILLDEIGEMSPKMQAGLLRVLQEKVIRPVGGTAEQPVDARIIAATHRNLDDMVAAGAFREDLYYRLMVIEIAVPPLRQRVDDIPMLIDHFLRLFATRYKRDRRTVSRAALRRLMAYGWPGNVRQLENALLNAWIMSDEAELEAADFELLEPPPTAAPPSASSREPVGSLDARTEQERERIVEALSACNWNRSQAAARIDMPRRTFYRRLKKYGIQ